MAKIRTSPARWVSPSSKGCRAIDGKHLYATATAKHYAVHSGPEPLRHGFDATAVARTTSTDTYLPAFRERGASTARCDR